MDPKTVVLDINSDEEVGCGEIREDDCDWISELFHGVDRDANDVVLVGDLVLNPKQGLKTSTKEIDDDDDDDDCVVLDGDPDKPVAIEIDSSGDSNELRVVSEKGQVACRDYPHPRHLCAKFPFTSTPHESYCDQCHCYVCDSLAPCVNWGTGIACIDHCHATDKEELWKVLRRSLRKSDKAASQLPIIPVTSLSMGLLQMNQVPPVAHLEPNLMPQPVLQSQISRPAFVHDCSMPTNVGIPNITNQGISQRSGYVMPRSKFQPFLISQQLLRSCNSANPRDRRHNVGNVGPQFASPRAVFKRTGSAGFALTGNRGGYISSNNSYRSQYSRNPPPVVMSSNKNPIRCQDFRSLMTPALDTFLRSSQQNVGSNSANSLPSQPRLSSQPNVGNGFPNSMPSRPQVSSQPFVGSVFANSLSSQPQPSCQPNAGSASANIMPSQPQVYSQTIPVLNDSSYVFQQGNQTQNPLDPCFTDFDSTWFAPANQSNQSPAAEISQLQNVSSIGEASLLTEFDPHFSGNANPGLLDFEFDSLILDNQLVLGAQEVSVPFGLNLVSPELNPIDAGIFFDF